ncbi:MAG: hypothetical protein WBG08_11135 [Litorimonas sp.]
MPDLSDPVRFVAGALALLTLAACGDTTEAPVASDPASDAAAVPVAQSDAETVADTPALPADMDGSVVIEVDRLIAEEAACLVMMQVSNGTDEPVTAGLFAFDVTGNGESAGANMFPQRAEPGGTATAQIILPGADCEDAQVIEGGQINCRIDGTEESCVDVTELRDGEVDFTLND